MVYQETPDYSSMKIFGCLSFAYNPVTVPDKLAPRGVPCVFLGYPPFKKGYRLLNLTNMQYFVSRDVLFHKSIFPFHKDSIDSYVSPIPQNTHMSRIPIVDDLFHYTPNTTITHTPHTSLENNIEEPTPTTQNPTPHDELEPQQHTNVTVVPGDPPKYTQCLPNIKIMW